MEKKDEAKPRTSTITKEKNFREIMFKYFYKETKRKEKEYNKIHNSNIKFGLIQNIDSNDNIINKILKLSYFYDRNFTGNKDFMHIPSLSQVAENIFHYPVVVAYRKLENGYNDILGVTTIKFEKNNRLKDNPFFPTRNEIVLSITGVLAKSAQSNDGTTHVRGIGKELYKSAIRAAFNLNKEKKIRLIAEIDCRNQKSMSAITNAVKDLQDEGYEICSYITGFYEIYNKSNILKEAPTFLLEINLNSNKYQDSSANFSYTHCRKEKLNADLAKVIKGIVKEQKISLNKTGKNLVIYHYITPINTQNILMEIGTSADGNNRVPHLTPVINYNQSKKTKSSVTELALVE